MKALLFAAVVLVLMGLLGWITFGRSSDRATITLETETMQNDLKRTGEAARNAARDGLKSLEGSVDPRVTNP